LKSKDKRITVEFDALVRICDEHLLREVLELQGTRRAASVIIPAIDLLSFLVSCRGEWI